MNLDNLEAFVTGFSIAFTLIFAIGAQNAFVLRQGIKGEYVGSVVLFCAISDAILIFLGVYGAGRLIEAFPQIGTIFTSLGIAFLLGYGLIRLRAAWKGNYDLDPSTSAATSRRAALLTCAAFTFLNPHVYVDTWVLMGGLSLPYHGAQKLAFALGGSFSSLVFFTSLGYGARFLRPLFQSQSAWRILDIIIGVFMCVLAFLLYQNH